MKHLNTASVKEKQNVLIKITSNCSKLFINSKSYVLIVEFRRYSKLKPPLRHEHHRLLIQSMRTVSRS